MIKELQKRNPYPESAFVEPTKAQYAKFNELMKEAGLCVAAYNGSWGRRVWNNCVEELKKILREEIEND